MWIIKVSSAVILAILLSVALFLIVYSMAYLIVAGLFKTSRYLKKKVSSIKRG